MTFSRPKGHLLSVWFSLGCGGELYVGFMHTIICISRFSLDILKIIVPTLLMQTG